MSNTNINKIHQSLKQEIDWANADLQKLLKKATTNPAEFVKFSQHEQLVQADMFVAYIKSNVGELSYFDTDDQVPKDFCKQLIVLYMNRIFGKCTHYEKEVFKSLIKFWFDMAKILKEDLGNLKELYSSF